MSFCDRAYDALFLKQSQLTGRSARRAVFDEMQRLVARSSLFVPLVYRGDYSAVNPAVRGWAPDMLFEFSNSSDWDVVR